ncbi:MAG: hypothetical protein WD557_14640 [Dehalococcoidia bacterium]
MGSFKTAFVDARQGIIGGTAFAIAVAVAIWVWDKIGSAPDVSTVVLYILAGAAVGSFIMLLQLARRPVGATREDLRGFLEEQNQARRPPRQQPDVEPQRYSAAGLTVAAWSQAIDLPWSGLSEAVQRRQIGLPPLGGILSTGPVLLTIEISSRADRILQNPRLRIQNGFVRAVVSDLPIGSMRGLGVGTDAETTATTKFDGLNVEVTRTSLAPGETWSEQFIVEGMLYSSDAPDFLWWIYSGDVEIASNRYQAIRLAVAPAARSASVAFG